MTPTAKTPPELEVQMLALGDIKPLNKNPRRGDVDFVRESLRRFGQYVPIVVRQETMEILKGNHTYYGAQAEAFERIACVVRSVPDDDEAAKLALTDNRASDLSTWDFPELADMLREFESLDGSGFDEPDFDTVIKQAAQDSAPDPADLPDDPPAPDPPKRPKTKPGDLIQLGDHRLLCGDAREPLHVKRLLGDVEPDCLWTDPPYGVDYKGVSRPREALQGDTPQDVRAMLDASFAAVTPHLADGAAVYVCHPPGPDAQPFIDAVAEAGWKFRQTLVWVKDSIVPGHSDYHYRHEAVLFGYARGAGRRGRGGKGWYGDNSQTSVFQIPRPKRSDDHSTVKPIALVVAHLVNSVPPKGAVVDLFAGSGTTLLAAEMLDQRAFLMEVEPGYCDVIVRRWEEQTGRTARRPARRTTPKKEKNN